MHIPKNPWPRTAAYWLYDEIMRHINPDLMIERIPLLEKKYASENAMEHEARMGEYQRAFDLYDRIYKDVTNVCADEAHKLKEESRKKAMGKEAAEQGSDIEHVEQKLTSYFGEQ